MPLLRSSFRIDLALTLIAVIASTGVGAGVVRAQITPDPRSNVIVDLSVIGDDGTGPSSNAAGRRSGLAMPGGKPPVSRLHGPTPMPMPVEAPSLTPPTETRSRLTLSPPRPETRMVTTPKSLAIEVARVPRPVTAPSRTGAMVAPMTTPAESLGTPATLPPPPPQWTQPAGAPTVSTPIPEPASSEPARSKPVEVPPMPSTETASQEPSPVDDTTPPASEVAETPPTETASTTPPPLPVPPTEAAQAGSAAERLPPPLPESVTAEARPKDTAGRIPPPMPPMAKTTETETETETETPLPEPAAKAPPPTAKTEQALLAPEGAVGAPGRTLQIPFAAGETELAESSEQQLDALAKDLTSTDTLRVQLLAYAGGEGTSPSKARRVSLSRALAVRSYLIESGIRTSRIDVRALGNKATSGSPDRVDVKVVER